MQILSTARRRREAIPAAVALAHWLTTFATERLVLEVAPTAHFLNYLLCKLLLLAALFGFWRLLWRALLDPERRASQERRTLCCALPYLAVLVLWMLLMRPYALVADERNLYERAIRLDSYAYWFNYLSGFYWITCLMAVPHYLGPVLIKMLLQALICGYCVSRQVKQSGKWGLLLYLLFLLPLTLDLGVSAHRLPTYGLAYLFFAAKLYYDWRDGKRLTVPELVWLSALVGVLAFWRSEGIYLTVLGAILICVAYRVRRADGLWKKLAVYALTLVLVFLPQLQAYADSEAGLSLRTKPLCGYLICNMFRNGLTEADVADERADIEAYLKFDTIKDYNERLGDENYYQAYVMDGVEKADYAAQERFCAAVKRVVLHHPLVYLRAQCGAFGYVHRQYPVSLSGLGAAVKSAVHVTYWPSIPTIFVLGACLYGLLRRRWLVFWLAGGGLANFAIVFLLMPAAYVKYFYVDFLLGWFFLLVGVIALLRRRSNAKKTA